tara:strand:- start:71 stop:604 length:534 start_codon:yes stop_codon:yes gene_type:complete
MPSGIIEIKKKDNIRFKGYVTAPAKGVFPGILLLHQEYGIDVSTRYLAEYFAAQNYTVFVPDLFWRKAPGCELISSNLDDINKSKLLLNEYNYEEGLDDITTCLKWLREKLKEDTTLLYDKLERDKKLYKEFLTEEDSFLKKRGFVPFEVKFIIKDLMNTRMDILKDILDEQNKKLS